ncbi:hypothetical protein [Bacillus thuringiensis]|uniref:hypothetical protein n=1 Tax=Bacillus thuringiensis TaxID=1428 RepID=UPI00164324F6|nr:hypothetical protein [Bacillus thuringiensis]
MVTKVDGSKEETDKGYVIEGGGIVKFVVATVAGIVLWHNAEYISELVPILSKLLN